jgi:hypothetical protein
MRAHVGKKGLDLALAGREAMYSRNSAYCQYSPPGTATSIDPVGKKKQP